jgi:hypothetical protein
MKSLHLIVLILIAIIIDIQWLKTSVGKMRQA